MKEIKSFYVTTPIYYVNDVPHIGHAYTTIAADVLARYKRLTGHQVLFLTGTDEHGQKVEESARQRGEEPIHLADRVVLRFQNLWKQLDISHNDFVRTTEERHIRAVVHFFGQLYQKGDIYPGEYEDWYCIPCESFWTDLQLQDGNCPDCRRPVKKVREESYFFRLSLYQDQLLRHIRSHPDFIQPESRKNEIIRFIESGLRDLSISRTSFKWGIPVPANGKHVIYVWLDALVNYLTAAGYPDSSFKKVWPAQIHLMGKDIVRFHAVYWPAFLLSAGLPLPERIFSHGWWTISGEKMSKSKGNVVDPYRIIERYGSDAFRYFLLREVPFGQDGDFSETGLVARTNSHLANDLGNLLSRTLVMIEKYCEGRIPAPHSGVQGEREQKFRHFAAALPDTIERAMTSLEFHVALQEIWKLVEYANYYIESAAPWNLAKSEATRPELDTALYHAAEALRILSLFLFPFIPSAARAIFRQLGQSPDFDSLRISEESAWGGLKPGILIQKGPSLFPKIEPVSPKEPPAPVHPAVPSLPASSSPPISIEDFQKIDLRVGKILQAERVPKSSKLLKLQIDLGSEKRQVVAGIGKRYGPEELIGMKVVVVANLKPARLMGIESQGMLLAAGGAEVEALASFLTDTGPGTKVK